MYNVDGHVHVSLLLNTLQYMGVHCTNINENAANVSIHMCINILYTCLMQCRLQLYNIMLFQYSFTIVLKFS